MFEAWTTPSAVLTDQAQRRQAQLYSQIVLVTLLASFICSVFYAVVLQGEDRFEFGLRCLPAFSFLGFCYLMGRSRWYLVGVIVMTGGLVVSGTTVIVLTDDSAVVATMLVLGMLGIVNAGAYLPAWAIALTGLGAVFNIALFSSMYPDVPKMSLFVIAAGMVVMTGVYGVRAQVFQMETHDRRWAAMHKVKWLRTLRSSFELAPVALCRLSPDGYIDVANVALSQLFGLEQAKLVDAPLEAIASPDEPMGNPIDMAPLMTGTLRRLNLRRKYRHSNGDVLTTRLSLGAVGEGGPGRVLVAVLEDITPYLDAVDRRDLRRQELSALLAERRQLLALVSREIRTPLTGVVGSVDILAGLDLTEEQAEYVDIVRSSSRVLLSVMDEAIEQDDFEVASGVDPAIVEVDPGGLIEEICRQVAPLAYEKGLEVLCETSKQLPTLVLADSARLHHLMKFLVGQAVAHADSGLVYCGVRAPRIGLLCADIEFEVYHSVGRVSGPAFGSHFLDRIQPIFATWGAEDLSVRRMVTDLDGEAWTEADDPEFSALRIQFNWAVCVGRKTPRSTSVARALEVWVVMEPLESQRVAVAMLADHGADVRAVGVVALIDAIMSEGGLPETLDVLLMDVGLTTPDGTLLMAHIRRRSTGSGLHVCQVGSLLQIGILARSTALYGGSQMVKPLTSSSLLATLSLDVESLELDRTEWSPEEPTEVTELPDDLGLPRILLVEDDPVHRRITVRLLGGMGVYVEAVANGWHALELYAMREYDLVLMDCGLPNLDGLQTTEKLRAIQGEGAKKPIIAMSASTLEDEKRRCFSVGMDDFLAKPVDPQTLSDMLTRWLPDRQTGVS
jgi:PAS domain S-box-containing protein